MTSIPLKILTRCFNKTRVPEGLLELSKDYPEAIIVTQSSSIVLKAFLRSLAIRSGWNDEKNLHSPEEQTDPECLNWLSFAQLSSWERIRTSDQGNKRFVPLSHF